MCNVYGCESAQQRSSGKMKRLLSFAALFLSVLAAPSIDPTLAEWNEYKAAYDKFYETPEEDARRLETYLESKRMVEEHNDKYQRGETSFTMAINKFSDWFPEELDRLNGLKIDRSMRRGQMYERQPDVVVPDSINWVEKGAVTSVKDQGHCGSCYAFSAAGALEALMFRKYKNITDLSVQELMDCSNSFGCEGGYPEVCYEVTMKIGEETEKSYPYKAKNDECLADEAKAVLNCTGYVDIGMSHEDDLREAVGSVGPVSVAIGVSIEFVHYKSGVYDGNCSALPNHAVLAVGYDKDNETGKDYWLVKNSWGTVWGDKGYVKVIRGEDKCFIGDFGNYPKD